MKFERSCINALNLGSASKFAFCGDINLIGLQPIKTRAELDSSTVLIFETNILRVSHSQGGLKPGLQPYVLFRGQTSPQVALVQ